MYTKTFEHCTTAEETEKELAAHIADKPAYNANGEEIGKVTDVTQSRKGKITSVTLDDGKSYLRGKIYALGDAVIVKVDRPKKEKPRKTDGTAKGTAAEIAEIDTENTPTEVAPTIIPEQNAPAETVVKSKFAPYPARKYGNFSFLIGKTVDKNIVNFQGETMLHKNDVITSNVLAQAKVSGKLIELCLHSK